jgi:16S rRNA (cytosine967-C5)-methyltransferase
MGPATAVARARAFLEEPPLTFRFNPRHADASDRAREAGLDFEASTLPGAYRARGGRPSDLAATGVLHLQDEGSQLVAHLAAAPGDVLDACAAPGGKTLLMADLHPSARVIAAERSLARLRTLDALRTRWGAGNVRVVGSDALHPPFRGAFDSVLLDAPCSGLGTIGRHPDIRWRCGPAEIVRQASRQRSMIQALAPLVRPGGRLVYATCSSEPEENEQVVEAFLAASPDFRIAPLPDPLRRFADGPFARTRPEEHGGDAFFAAMLER